jgi:hypothetical protein
MLKVCPECEQQVCLDSVIKKVEAMTPILYPVDFPIDVVKDIVAALQSGGLRTLDRKTITKQIWLLEGYLLGKAVGDADVVGFSVLGHEITLPHIDLSKIAVPPAKVILPALEKILESPEGEHILVEALGTKLPYATILKWTIQLLLEVV